MGKISIETNTMASQRKSARTRQPSKKYTVDAFEGLHIDDANTGPSHVHLAPEDDSGDDEDFQVEAHPSPDPAEDEIFNAADVDVEEGDDTNIGLDPDFEDGDSIVALSDNGEPSFRAGRRIKSEWGKTKASRSAADPRFNPRGLLEPATRGSKEVQRLFMFGPTVEDQTPPLQGHYKWSAEPTLPSRRANSAGFGGFKRSFFLSDDAVKQEADEGWEWYDIEGGKEAFQARQITAALNSTEAQAYITPVNVPDLTFVMGPYKAQRLFKLPVGSTVDLNEAWAPETTSPDATQPAQDAKTLRQGWMINLGQKVSSLDWAPNHIGTRQFIAASTLPAIDTRTEEPPYESASAPAFTPQPPYRSSIQIWEIVATPDGRVDLKRRPILRKVLCTTWGDIRSLKWCPAPRKFGRPHDMPTLNLGLLACLCGDGSLRILDVSIAAAPESGCEYVRVQRAAFATKPPNTLCTTFVWLSATGIAAGCANGTIGVWDIPSSLQETSMPGPAAHSSSESAGFAEPVIYASLATTYILGIISCYPSRPNVILATTMAGHLYMVDLADLTTNTTLSPAATIRSTRSRIGRTILVWHDWSQMALSADDNFTLVAYPLRRFFRQIGCTRFRSPAAAVAVSPVHPFVISACVGGEVTCNNPLRRAYESKVPIWNQIWFTHEWKRIGTTDGLGKALDGEDTIMQESGEGVDDESGEQFTRTASTGDGMSRILEGYKCEQIKLFNTEDSFSHRENGTIYTTVYELKTSITSVGWNPNMHVGGWVAAGMASGLLRIEDIAS